MSRILIVDDSWLARKSIANILQSHGHEIDEAVDGRQALDKCAETAPDCMLLDLLMPEFNGFQVMETLKEQNSSIPIIVLSADIQDTTREKCSRMGAIDFLNKPITDESLHEALKKALGGKKSD